MLAHTYHGQPLREHNSKNYCGCDHSPALGIVGQELESTDYIVERETVSCSFFGNVSNSNCQKSIKILLILITRNGVNTNDFL